MTGSVSILIPRGTQNGDKIAIPNKGYKKMNNERGKLVVDVCISVPKQVSNDEKELILKLKEITKFNPGNIVNIK